MSLFYQCIMCQQENLSIVDLHNHHTRYHNPEELSQTIIDLHGFKVWNNIRPMKRKYLKENLGDSNNNNECRGRNRHEEVIDLPRQIIHNATNCAINCSQFMVWERELNKREEINEGDFLDSIESLCYDLTKKQSRRGRKKKEKPEENKEGRLMQYIEGIIGVKNTVEQQHNEPCQVATTCNTNDIMANITINNVTQTERKRETEEVENSEQTTMREAGSNTSDLMTSITINNITSTERKNEVKATENNEQTKLPEAESSTNINVPMHQCMSNNFSWCSIITGTDNEKKVIANERNS